MKNSIRNHIKNLYSSVNKTGLFGTLGNKGNVMMRFDIKDLSFVFSCSHLAAHLAGNESRVKEIIEIINKPMQIDLRKNV